MIQGPHKGPVDFLFDTGDRFNGVENILPLCCILDIGVDEKGVCLQMDVLHHDLEAIEATHL